jgi:hypothetical protein
MPHDMGAAMDAFVRDHHRRLGNFVTNLREQGIHVGMGSPARCITCSQAWPCEDSA